jgi:hypothetical protein
MPLRPFPIALPRPVPAVALACALAATPAFAAPSPADGASPDAPPAWIHPLVGVLLTGTVGTSSITVKNPDGSSATGSPSGRYEAFAGAEFPVDPNGLAMRLTAGIHVTANFKGAGGSEHLTSFPVEATLWYPLSDQVRVGAGMRYALHSRFSGAGGKTSDNLNPAPALVLGVGYQWMPHLLLDMRYVYQRYEQPSGSDIEASHWGLGLTARY